jgi:hypothetical protein
MNVWKCESCLVDAPMLYILWERDEPGYFGVKGKSYRFCERCFKLAGGKVK